MSDNVRHAFTSNGDVCICIVEESGNMHQISLELFNGEYAIVYRYINGETIEKIVQSKFLIDDVMEHLKQEKIRVEDSMFESNPNYKYPEFEEKGLRELIKSRDYASTFKCQIVETVKSFVKWAFNEAVNLPLTSSDRLREQLVFAGRVIGCLEATYIDGPINIGSRITNESGVYDIQSKVFYTTNGWVDMNAVMHLHFDGVYGFNTLDPDYIKKIDNIPLNKRREWATKVLISADHPGIMEYFNKIDFHVPEKQN